MMFRKDEVEKLHITNVFSILQRLKTNYKHSKTEIMIRQKFG